MKIGYRSIRCLTLLFLLAAGIATMADCKRSEQSMMQLELRARKPQYYEGEIPELEAVITNAGSQETWLCTYLIDHRLLSSLTAGPYEYFPFASPNLKPLTQSDFKLLRPGEKYAVNLPLPILRDWKFIYRASAPLVLDRDLGIRGFPVGTFAFKASLLNRVPVYQGKAGVYDFNVASKDLFSEIPKGEEQLPVSGVWKGELEATFDLDFFPERVKSLGPEGYLKEITAQSHLVLVGKISALSMLSRQGYDYTNDYRVEVESWIKPSHGSPTVAFQATHSYRSQDYIPDSGSRVLAFLKENGQKSSPVIFENRTMLFQVRNDGTLNGPVGRRSLQEYLELLQKAGVR